jgi:hypothetical protein
MSLREGEVNPGDKDKVIRYKKKLRDWEGDVVNGQSNKKPTREDMLSNLFQLENRFNGYWCEGEKCGCIRTQWVIYASKSNCWECMHNSCACSPPLVWDDAEQAYYRFFLFCDGINKEERLDDNANWQHGDNQFQTRGEE